MDMSAAIAQVEEAIAAIDEEVGTTPLDWDGREGTRNLRVKVLNHRKHSLLVALEALKAAE